MGMYIYVYTHMHMYMLAPRPILFRDEATTRGASQNSIPMRRPVLVPVHVEGPTIRDRAIVVHPLLRMSGGGRRISNRGAVSSVVRHGNATSYAAVCFLGSKQPPGPATKLFTPPFRDVACDDGVHGQADAGRENEVTQKWRTSCSSRAPAKYRGQSRRQPQLPNSCGTSAQALLKRCPRK